MGCPWESVHSQGIGCRCIKMFGYKCGVEEAKLRGFVQVGQNLGEFFCAPEISSDSSLGKNVKCRGIGEFLPIKPSTCGELAPVCHRGSSNRTNKFYLFIFVCVLKRWINQSICGRRPSLEGRGRSTSSVLDTLVRSNLNPFILYTFSFLFHLTCVSVAFGVPESHLTLTVDQRLRGRLRARCFLPVCVGTHPWVKVIAPLRSAQLLVVIHVDRLPYGEAEPWHVVRLWRTGKTTFEFDFLWNITMVCSPPYIILSLVRESLIEWKSRFRFLSVTVYRGPFMCDSSQNEHHSTTYQIIFSSSIVVVVVVIVHLTFCKFQTIETWELWCMCVRSCRFRWLFVV